MKRNFRNNREVKEYDEANAEEERLTREYYE